MRLGNIKNRKKFVFPFAIARTFRYLCTTVISQSRQHKKQPDKTFIHNKLNQNG